MTRGQKTHVNPGESQPAAIPIKTHVIATRGSTLWWKGST